MTAIYRYTVPADDQIHPFVLTGDPLGVGLRRTGVVEFWALHDDDEPGVGRLFTVVGTGHELPASFAQHWGFAYDHGGTFVWHLIEVTP